MVESGVRRTFRRGIALLLVPLSLFLWAWARLQRSAYGAGAPLGVLAFAGWAGTALAAGASLYLLVSLALGLAGE